MLIVFFLYILAFFIFTAFGFIFVKIIGVITKKDIAVAKISFDEFFFIGFLILSTITGFLSIVFPIGNQLLLIIILLALSFCLINFRELRTRIKELFNTDKRISKSEIVILLFIFLFLMTAVVQNISLYDTGLYHAQVIKWIRNYPVIPGLGNLHGRFAYNSMFFVIAGLFTFKIKDVLIFPLNGICFVILIVRMFLMFQRERKTGTLWKASLYAILLLLCILILTRYLNSPSPDVICAILIIYSFILIVDQTDDSRQIDLYRYILIILLVFNCITFKLSSVCLVLFIPLLLRSETLKRGLIAVFTGIIILTPFLIRNYYISGYLVYPFPGIDIFNVDWKIPLERALSEKAWIVSWARIPGKPYTEVLNLHFNEWIWQWFKSMGDASKVIVSFNVFSLIALIIMIIKKDYFLVCIQLLILINLIFWFTVAPDPRFAYGFLFLGIAMTIAYMIKLFGNLFYLRAHRYTNIFFICLLLLVGISQWKFPLGTLRSPSLWVLPDKYETAITESHKTNFSYLMPVSDPRCYYSDIPCVPYPLDNIVLRGNKISEGFKVITDVKNRN